MLRLIDQPSLGFPCGTSSFSCMRGGGILKRCHKATKLKPLYLLQFLFCSRSTKSLMIGLFPTSNKISSTFGFFLWGLIFCEHYVSPILTIFPVWQYQVDGNSFFVNLPRSISCLKDKLSLFVAFSQQHPSVVKEIRQEIECYANSRGLVFG